MRRDSENKPGRAKVELAACKTLGMPTLATKRPQTKRCKGSNRTEIVKILGSQQFYAT